MAAGRVCAALQMRDITVARLTERIGRLGFLASEILDEIAPVLDGLERGAGA